MVYIPHIHNGVVQNSCANSEYVFIQNGGGGGGGGDERKKERKKERKTYSMPMAKINTKNRYDT